MPPTSPRRSTRKVWLYAVGVVLTIVVVAMQTRAAAEHGWAALEIFRLGVFVANGLCLSVLLLVELRR